MSLRTVFFVNTQKGWVGGGGNSVGRTTDGGANWIWEHPAGEPRRTFMAMSFVNENMGWIVDNFGGILHTEDGEEPAAASERYNVGDNSRTVH